MVYNIIKRRLITLSNLQEFYLCEKCNKEFWINKEETYKKGSLCPNGCDRNFQMYLGETEDEINKRKEVYLTNKKKKEFMDSIVDTEEEEVETFVRRPSRKSDGYYEDLF